MNRFWWTGVAALFIISSVSAGGEQSNENLRTITVNGTGEVKVKPDKAVVRLGVTTFSANLSEAKKDADDRMKRILALMAQFAIDEKDYKTDYINISPQYKREEYAERRDKFLGYEVSSGLVITMRQLSKLDLLLADAVEAGATHIYGVSFETSALRKHRDEARKLAIGAARDKAVLLTGELGQKIGRARNINENVESYWGYSQQANRVGGWGGGGSSDESEEDREATIVPGEISVKATVSVVFDLE